MAPLYKPPTKVVTVQMSYAALVQRADPEFNRRKFREEELYGFQGKYFYGNPYVRGPYATPVKRNTVNYAGPATFQAGDLTGVGFDVVQVNSINPNPGTLTTRTAAQMFSDISGATPLMQYQLRISNTGGGGALTLAAGAGVTLVGNMVVKQNTFSDFVVTLTDSTHATITTSTSGSPYNSVSH